MAIREFKYRGKTLEELKKLSLKELAEILPSRERRKMKRGFTHVEKTLIEKAKNAKPGQFVKTHARDMIILPDFVGKRFGVHSGKEYRQVDITSEMIGHRLGEFALTRKSVKHTGPGIGATRGSKFVALK